MRLLRTPRLRTGRHRRRGGGNGGGLTVLLVIAVGAMSYVANYVGWTATILLVAVAGTLLLWFLARRTMLHTPKAKDLFAGLQRVPSMSGSQFEVFVAEVLRVLGYKTTVLGGAGDQGVDVIATAGNERLAIQCKNYRKPVGNKPVQEVYAGSRHHGCTAAYVVAPKGFTKGAVELARSVGVSLYDAQSLQKWIRQIDKREQEPASVEPHTVGPDVQESSTVDLDESETKMQRGVDKHTVKVGSFDLGSSVGETVSFTAELLGTAAVNGGADDGVDGNGLDYTFYRLLDGTFRVHVVGKGMSMLIPSNMTEALNNGQRNNFSYGRMTLEELKAHDWNFWPAYEAIIKNHPDTVRDID